MNQARAFFGVKSCIHWCLACAMVWGMSLVAPGLDRHRVLLIDSSLPATAWPTGPDLRRRWCNTCRRIREDTLLILPQALELPDSASNPHPARNSPLQRWQEQQHAGGVYAGGHPNAYGGVGAHRPVSNEDCASPMSFDEAVQPHGISRASSITGMLQELS